MANYRELYAKAAQERDAAVKEMRNMNITNLALKKELEEKAAMVKSQEALIAALKEKVQVQSEYIAALTTIHEAEQNEINQLMDLVRFLLPEAPI